MMCVSDILKVKGNMLFMVMFDKLLCEVVDMMVEYDIGLFVVMEYGDFVGMLMFCEIILCLYVNGGVIGDVQVCKVMDELFICMLEMDVNEVCWMMFECYVCYMLVFDKKVLMGVILFYDVVKMVVEVQSFENWMLKVYICDWLELEVEVYKL